MQGFNETPQRAGEPITARFLNEMKRAIAGLLKMSVGHGLAITWVNGAPHLRATGGGSVRHAKTKGSGIGAATSATQMTSAVIDLWQSSATGALTDTTVDVTAWNKSTTAIAANTHVLIQEVDGLDVVVWEACPA